jgi:hypothetical protein
MGFSYGRAGDRGEQADARRQNQRQHKPRRIQHVQGQQQADDAQGRRRSAQGRGTIDGIAVIPRDQSFDHLPAPPLAA